MPDYSGGFPRPRPGEGYDQTQTGSPSRVDQTAPSGAPDVWTLQRRLEDLQRQLDAQASARQPVLLPVQQIYTGGNGWASFANAIDLSVPVPRGYGQALVLMRGSATHQVAVGGTGTQREAARCALLYTDTALQTITGPTRSQNGAENQIVTAYPDLAALVQNLATGSELRLRVQATSTGSIVAGSAEAQVAATITFLR